MRDPKIKPANSQKAKLAARPKKLGGLGDIRHLALLIIMAAVTVGVISAWNSYDDRTTLAQLSTANLTNSAADRGIFEQRYAMLLADLRKFEDAEAKDEVQVVSNVTVQQDLSSIESLANVGHYRPAGQQVVKLRAKLATWQKALATELASIGGSAQPSGQPGDYLNVPILIYHDPPPDLDQQLQYLKDNDYTTITPDQLVAGLSGQITLPDKPILITFDDGLETQMTAFTLLKQYQMKATFYIIDGGEGSDFHIGANRKMPDPQGGPDYLTWSQIRTLDKSGLVTIGSHTVDHLALATVTPEVQWFEISTGKSELESEIGHPVDSFAYPYGSYNNTTLQLVAQAGFTSAVTTNPGTYQSAAGLLTLYRIRSVYGLP